MYNEKALAFDSKHIDNWREDANGLMILVRRRLPFRWTSHLLEHYMIEWFGLSRRRRILVAVLYFIPNKLSRCLGFLPLSDLSSPGWRERFNFVNTSSSRYGTKTRCSTCVLVWKFDDELCVCCGCDHGPRVDSPIPASDSVMV